MIEQIPSHCNEGNNDTCAKGNPLMDKESILQAWMVSHNQQKQPDLSLIYKTLLQKTLHYNWIIRIKLYTTQFVHIFNPQEKTNFK